MAKRAKDPAAVKLGSKGGKARGRSLTSIERQLISAKGGQGAWASMTPAERSAEMKRRAKKRKKKPKK
jgi:hypothetical protein